MKDTVLFTVINDAITHVLSIFSQSPPILSDTPMKTSINLATISIILSRLHCLTEALSYIKKPIYTYIILPEYTFVNADLIKYIRTIQVTTSSKVMFKHILYISNTFQNTMLENTQKRILLCLPYMYLKWFKQKYLRHKTFTH